MIADLLSVPLSTVAAITVADFQTGGIKGRQMVNNILALEAKIIEFWMRRYPRSGVFALDQATAFPSISRKNIFWVLYTMGFDAGTIKGVKGLHKGGLCLIAIGRRVYCSFEATSGVNTGCPSAMTLFVLAFDPCSAS